MTSGDLQALGVMLRRARESLALSLEEAEAQTRIKVKFLEALENGDLTLLPSIAHARGFLRNYAQFLRLDANNVAAQFSELTGTGRLGTAAMPTQPHDRDAQQSYQPPQDAGLPARRSSPAFDQGAEQSAPPLLDPYPPPPGGGRGRSTYVPPASQVGPSTPLGVSTPPAGQRYPTPIYGLPAVRPETVSAQPVQSGTRLHRLIQSNLFIAGVLLVSTVIVSWWAVGQLSAVSSAEFLPTQSSGLPGDGGNITPVNPAATFAATQTATQAGITLLDRVLLSITVTERTWIRIIVDGAVVFEGQAVPGSILQYEGRQYIQVLAGNASGLTITYNGQSIGVLGKQGEVVGRIFTPSGQMTLTPTLTPTPTNTNVPTPTSPFTPTP